MALEVLISIYLFLWLNPTTSVGGIRLGQLFRYINISENISGHDLFRLPPVSAGTIPNELRALTKLKVLDLSSNQLVGKRCGLRMISFDYREFR